ARRVCENAPFRRRGVEFPCSDPGGVAEWLMATVCKTVRRKTYTGSNPVPTTGLLEFFGRPSSSVVEHTLGKGEVVSSILTLGSALQFHGIKVVQKNGQEG